MSVDTRMLEFAFTQGIRYDHPHSDPSDARGMICHAQKVYLMVIPVEQPEHGGYGILDVRIFWCQKTRKSSRVPL